MQIPTCSLLVQMCWMQNRYLKLTAKGRQWVRSTRVHHDTRTCQQPEAAGCLQEEHCLSPSSFLPSSRNKLPDSLFLLCWVCTSRRFLGWFIPGWQGHTWSLVLMGSWFSSCWPQELHWCWPLWQERRHRGLPWAAPGFFVHNCVSLW